MMAKPKESGIEEDGGGREQRRVVGRWKGKEDWMTSREAGRHHSGQNNTPNDDARLLLLLAQTSRKETTARHSN